MLLLSVIFSSRYGTHQYGSYNTTALFIGIRINLKKGLAIFFNRKKESLDTQEIWRKIVGIFKEIISFNVIKAIMGS